MGRWLALLAIGITALAGTTEVWLRTRSEQDLGFGYREGHLTLARPADDPGRNRIGFHDLQPTAKTPGSHRILLLGGAAVAGVATAIDQIVGQRLEFHLNRDVRGFDVVSLGQPGWAEPQQLQALAKWGRHLAPDLVMSLVDPRSDVLAQSADLRRRARERSAVEQEALASAPGLWLERSFLNRLLSHRLALRAIAAQALGPPVDYLVYAAPENPDPEWEHAWNATLRMLRQSRDFAQTLGAGYSVVSASRVVDVEAGLRETSRQHPLIEWDLDAPDHRIREFCHDNGIPFISLESTGGEFDDAGASGSWSARANDRVARAIADQLLRTGARPGGR